MQTELDLIDSILEKSIRRPGLIDWSLITTELRTRGITIDRQLLHRRARRLLRARPGVRVVR